MLAVLPSSHPSHPAISPSRRFARFALLKIVLRGRRDGTKFVVDFIQLFFGFSIGLLKLRYHAFIFFGNMVFKPSGYRWNNAIAGLGQRDQYATHVCFGGGFYSAV